MDFIESVSHDSHRQVQENYLDRWCIATVVVIDAKFTQSLHVDVVKLELNSHLQLSLTLSHALLLYFVRAGKQEWQKGWRRRGAESRAKKLFPGNRSPTGHE